MSTATDIINIAATAPSSALERLCELQDEIAKLAADFGISAMDLRLRTGLHLPLLWAEGNFRDIHSERREIERLAGEIHLRQQSHERWLSYDPPLLSDLRFAELDQEEIERFALPILTSFHYINSFRRDSTHYVLKAADGRVAALATVSRFDMPSVLEAFTPLGPQEHLGLDNLLVLSRVYAFRWAPKNAISHLLANLTRDARKRHPSAWGMTTYLNSNLGFSGASYRASGWRLVARESLRHLSYLDRQYITARDLAQYTGLSNPSQQISALGNRLIFSDMPLMPLDIYATCWGPMTTHRFPIDPVLLAA